MTATEQHAVSGAQPHAALRTWLGLLGCANLIERQVRRRLREEFDTTLPRFDVLAQLEAAQRTEAGADGLTMSELSRRLMVTNGNLTGLVERLAQEGVVSRASSAVDRRSQIVRLTEAGQQALDAMLPAHELWIEELFADLSSYDRAQLQALLGRLRASIRHSLTETEPT
jgi:DNA-binding MarR family transcriptional regulator